MYMNWQFAIVRASLIFTYRPFQANAHQTRIHPRRNCESLFRDHVAGHRAVIGRRCPHSMWSRDCVAATGYSAPANACPAKYRSRNRLMVSAMNCQLGANAMIHRPNRITVADSFCNDKEHIFKFKLIITNPSIASLPFNSGMSSKNAQNEWVKWPKPHCNRSNNMLATENVHYHYYSPHRVWMRCSREWRVCHCQSKGITSSSHRHSFHLLNQLRVVDTNRKPNKYKARLTELRGWETM